MPNSNDKGEPPDAVDNGPSKFEVINANNYRTSPIWWVTNNHAADNEEFVSKLPELGGNYTYIAFSIKTLSYNAINRSFDEVVFVMQLINPKGTPIGSKSIDGFRWTTFPRELAKIYFTINQKLTKLETEVILNFVHNYNFKENRPGEEVMKYFNIIKSEQTQDLY